jgi:hypothetical protein
LRVDGSSRSHAYRSTICTSEPLGGSDLAGGAHCAFQSNEWNQDCEGNSMYKAGSARGMLIYPRSDWTNILLSTLNTITSNMLLGEFQEIAPFLRHPWFAESIASFPCRCYTHHDYHSASILSHHSDIVIWLATGSGVQTAFPSRRPPRLRSGGLPHTYHTDTYKRRNSHVRKAKSPLIHSLH